MKIDRDEFRNLMGEVAALPSGDPLRGDVERRIAEEEAWAASEWALLMEENEIFETALPAVELPGDLEQRLLATLESPRVASRRRWIPIAVAAAVLLGLVGWWLSMDGDVERSKDVAVLSIDNHLKHVADDPGFRTSDPRALERALVDAVPFKVAIPDFAGRMELRGGQKCSLGASPVLLSFWQSTEGPVSLFQCPAADVDLPARMAPGFYHGREGQPKRCASVWCEDGRAYVLVGMDHRHLQRVLGDRYKN